MLIFEKKSPTALEIPENAVENFLMRLQKSGLSMHSVHFLYHDKLILDHYYAPFQRGQLHRMFSISKSYTAVAIALLIEEGKLSIDDTIASHFPEYSQNLHPWIASMTIKDMLMMRTCHQTTTYKIDPSKNWVESFFKTEPSHPAGAFFHYDTGSAHVLCALVEKLTGLSLLDYLREKLAPLGLSTESYMLTDPFGVSMGGTGLVAPSSDLIRFGYFLLHGGNVEGQQLLSAAAVDELTANWSDTARNATVHGEAQGYGMMIWRMRNDGYMCYGMGGQFILCYPKYNFCCCTTADTQAIRGGNQFIFDALEEEILPHLKENVTIVENSSLSKGLEAFLETVAMQPLTAANYTNCHQVPVNLLGRHNYKLNSNPQGFSDLSIFLEEGQGSLCYKLQGLNCELSFGLGKLIEGRLPGYNFCYYASGAFTAGNQLCIRVEVIDSHVGTISFEFHFGKDDIAIALKKIEEDYYNEYQGCLYGHLT